VHYFEGRVDGHIADKPMGMDGFGYDPIFIPSGYQDSFAQLPMDVKNKLSHRAQAVQQLLAFLNT
jgi:XTP/dITP diphosphohydrolase